MSKKRKNASAIHTIWVRMSDPFLWAIVLVLVGLILAATVVTNMPGQVSSTWWITAFRAPEALRSVVSLSVLALGIGLVLGLGRWRTQQGAPIDGRPDFVSANGPEPKKGIARHAPLIGLVLMVLGVALALGEWALSQRLMPPSRVTVPANKKIEAYPAITSNSAVKVMLPSRVYVRAINVDDQTATLEFLRVGEEEGQGQVQTLRAFDPVEIKGFRWSILGVEYTDAVLTAVLKPTGEGKIPAGGTVGDSLQFEIGGPKYKVLRIARNYLGVLGPAVELEHPDDGPFWVFARAQAGKKTPDFGHGLTLERLERAPVAMIAVSEAPVQDVLPAAGILFVVGLALFLFVPDIVRRGRDEDDAFWSLNEASLLAEQGGGDDE